MIQRQWLDIEYVQARASNLALPQNFDQSVLVDEPASGSVDKERGRFEEGKVRGRYNVVGGGRVDEVQRDNVRLAKEVFFGWDEGHTRGFCPFWR